VFGSVILNCNMKGNVKFVQCGTKNTNLMLKITSDEVDLDLPYGMCVGYGRLGTTVGGSSVLPNDGSRRLRWSSG
jgi:hypothetical protein